MTGTFTIKAGDTLPVLIAQLLSTTQQAADLTNVATIELHIAEAVSRASIFQGPAAILDQLTAKVQFDWNTLAPEDLLAPGLYIAEWQVTFNDSSIQTFPNDGYFFIHVMREL